MSVVQYEQTNSIDSADALADNLASNKNDTLSALQLKNIGVGLFGLSPVSQTTGMLNTNEGFDRINQSLKVILHTVKGEIPMLPKLGSDLDRLLFEPLDTILDDQLEYAITEAVNEFEKRIQILNITISHDERVLNKAHIYMEYVLTNTNIVHQFEETIYTANGGVV